MLDHEDEFLGPDPDPDSAALREVIRDAMFVGGASLDRLIERFFEREAAR